MLLATVAAGALLPIFTPRHAPDYAPVLALLAVWAVFALWSTVKSIRWADAHGWDRLP